MDEISNQYLSEMINSDSSYKIEEFVIFEDISENLREAYINGLKLGFHRGILFEQSHLNNIK